MAGIGFELKKIYRKDGISRTLMGAMYSCLITIGPTIIIITVILLLYLFLDMSGVGMAKRELLSSTILYIFIFSVVMTSPFNSVFSRYLADKFYEEEFDDILCSYYVGLAITSVIGIIMALPMMFSLYFRGGIDIAFIAGAYCMWASAVVIFFSITYLHATKDYRLIAIFFFLSMIVGGLLAAFLYFIVGFDQIHAIIWGLAFSFFMIAFCEFSYVRYYFKGGGNNYSECVRYIWRYKGIFLTNFFYILGLYIHNFVFWTTPSHLYVANTYYSHMNYDMATCLAMFTNISATVIFTVIAETHFHEVYQDFMEAVIGGTYRLIQKNKRIMFRTLSTQLGQVFATQIAITCVIFMLLMIFGLQLGFSSMTMRIYPVLAVGFLGVFVMYCNIVYLYYFEDSFDSAMTAFIFCFGTLVGAIVSAYFLPVEFYGMGLLFGMLCGWTYSFFRLRHLERNFDAHIFCRYKVIDTMKSSTKGRIVYRKD
jgi:polysaccharide biosynthesis protein PelG